MTYPAPSTTGSTVVVRLLVGFSQPPLVLQSDAPVVSELGALATNDGRPAPGGMVVEGMRKGSRMDGMTSRGTIACLITRLGS